MVSVFCQDLTYVRSTVNLAISATALMIAKQASYVFKMPTTLLAENVSRTGMKPSGTSIGIETSAFKIVSEAQIAVGKQAIGMKNLRLTSYAVIHICLISAVVTKNVFPTWTFILGKGKTARTQDYARMTWSARKVL